MRRLLALLLALAVAGSTFAEEGMWQPAQLPEIAPLLRERGLELSAEQLAQLTEHPLGAVVGFGFCTASFVSPQGLVVTNHHCAYGAIQYNSTAERNLLADGFLAARLEDELAAEPNMRIYVTESIEDVSEQINAGLRRGMSGLDRQAAIDREAKALVADCEATPGYRCDVYVFHQGLSFQLVRQLEIRDVRLVYAPKEAIGKFGGDVDNWMWPRHTGDYAFLRAYVGADGAPAAYAAENVPFQPRHHLKLQPNGVADGDFVMVAGYPGSTHRYRLGEEVEEAVEWRYPAMVDLYRRYVGIVEAHPDADAQLKYAGNIASWNNTLKNFEGQIEGLARADAVAARQAREAELGEWLDGQRWSGRRSARAIAALRGSLTMARSTRERDLLVSGQLGRLGLFRAVLDTYRLSIERERDDAAREYGYQMRDEVRIQGRLQQLDRRFDPVIERQLMTEILTRYVDLPESQRVPELDRWLDGAVGRAAIDARVAALYRDSELTDGEARLRWLAADREAIEASEDPYLQLVVAFMPAWLRLESERKELDGRGYEFRPQYMQAMIDFNREQGRAIYPDANNSLRVSFGAVTGYSPRDGVQYLPFTGLPGLVEKHTGVDPFDATQAQIDLIQSGVQGRYADPAVGTVPVNFLADLDITGGNSGSPTLNARGELVGLAFDGNIESVSADWVFEPAITRSIHVDVRYMLWVMEHLDGAGDLIREMGLSLDD